MAKIAYFVVRAFSHIRRNPVVASVTIGTVAVVFLILGIFGLIGHNLQLLVDRLSSGLQLSVFLEDECSSAQRQAIEELLKNDPATSATRFVDRDAALERFRRQFGSQAAVLEGLGENPLPASFQVVFKSAYRTPRAIQALAQKVINLPGVEEAQYGQAWLDKFFNFLKTIRYMGLFIGSLIVLAALLIVSNTIRLSLYARREDIHILKLVGATDRFIKVPFYLEGFLLGLLGAALGIAGTWLVFSFLVPEVLIPMWPGNNEIAVEFLPPIGVFWMIGGGAVLGLLGTLTSLWRHLRI